MVGLVLAMLAFGVSLAGVPQTQPPTPFRTGVVLVPVDVRVVDAAGNPVTDLTAGDFTVFENGVRQEIAHFSTQSYLSPTSPTPTASAPPRTFFLLLGRGRLNEPTKALDAAITFVQSHLRPDDRVGLLAYLHLVEPTADHGAVVRLLERYLARHDAIEDKLTRDARRGPGAPSWPTRPDTQAAIAGLFDAPGLPPVHQFPGAAGGSTTPTEDGPALINALEYLRHVDGEKHLVAVLEKALPVGKEGETFYGPRATSARVSVFVIQAGGLEGARPIRSVFSTPDLPTAVLWARANRTLAEVTGGQASFYQNADASFARLARVTSFQYLLGYYPIKPPRDGEHRTLRVVVARSGVTALYRHAYEARPPVEEPLDLQRMFVRSQILRLASMPQTTLPGALPHANIPMKVSPVVTRGPDDVMHVTVTLAVDPAYVTVTRAGDRYLISLDVAAFVRNAARTILAERWEHLDLKLDATAYARLKGERIRHALSLAVTGRPSQLVVVVYEYESNRGRWATARLR